MVFERVRWHVINRARKARVEQALKLLAKPHEAFPTPWRGSADLVVSLTSYPPRYPTLHLTIESLLRQSLRPTRLVLWVALKDYGSLPQTVFEQASRGLEIRTCEDMRSYKKLIPSLTAFPNAYIATCDDDIYYEPDWLDQLVAALPSNPNAIFAHRVHFARFNAAGDLEPYLNWRHDASELSRRSANSAVFPTGIGGVLYPPKTLAPFVQDYATAKRLAPTADDIWFFWAARLAGTTAIKTKYKFLTTHWPGSQEAGLHVENTIADGNDRQISAMQEFFGPAI